VSHVAGQGRIHGSGVEPAALQLQGADMHLYVLSYARIVRRKIPMGIFSIPTQRQNAKHKNNRQKNTRQKTGV